VSAVTVRNVRTSCVRAVRGQCSAVLEYVHVSANTGRHAHPSVHTYVHTQTERESDVTSGVSVIEGLMTLTRMPSTPWRGALWRDVVACCGVVQDEIE